MRRVAGAVGALCVWGLALSMVAYARTEDDSLGRSATITGLTGLIRVIGQKESDRIL